jgi:hypothetical protein
MDSPILKLGHKVPLYLRQWEGHFGTAQTNYFSALGTGTDISNGSITV